MNGRTPIARADLDRLQRELDHAQANNIDRIVLPRGVVATIIGELTTRRAF